MAIKAEDLVAGRWPELLKAAGMDPGFFTGRQTPCPMCGGKDRFRWCGNKGDGLYVCNQCTEGKYRGGFDLLMRHMGYREFREAADHVREYFGYDESSNTVDRPMPAPAERNRPDPAKALTRMHRQWSGSRAVQEGDPVHRYLMRRVPGLEVIPTEIRCHPALTYWEQGDDGKPVARGDHPAMLVRGFDPAGNLVQMHKTYLNREGGKAPVPYPKKTDSGVGSNSFALRLGMPAFGGDLGVAEGIETALACSLLTGIPTWPCHSASILANFVVPDVVRDLGVRKIRIFADADEVKNGKRTGQEAALRLSDNLRRQGFRSLILRPAKVGDFADIATAA